MSLTPDLFASTDERAALAEFHQAFESWRSAEIAANRLQRTSTLQVYADMWSAFAAWCVGQSPAVTLASLREEGLVRFLQSREEHKQGQISARHAWRLLSLIDRVLDTQARYTRQPKNRAAEDFIRRSDEVRRANMSERPAIDHLDIDQARTLVLYLSAVRPGTSDHRRLTSWQDLRNVTAVALHLGAGLTPGDVRELLLDAPVCAGGRWKDVPWKLRVPGNGNRPARETPIAPWAGQLLRQWLVVRAQSRLPGEPRPDSQGLMRGPFLLPGRSGQLWGKMAHYQAVKAVLEAAGVDDPGSGSGGAFRLRHTFALRQLRKNRAETEVARWLGIADPAEMNRYHAVLGGYEQPV